MIQPNDYCIKALGNSRGSNFYHCRGFQHRCATHSTAKDFQRRLSSSRCLVKPTHTVTESLGNMSMNDYTRS